MEDGMKSLPALAATGIGSVPFLDNQAAVRLILENLTEIPYWPQMAQKGFQEDMVSQGAGGLPLIYRDMEQRLVRVTDAGDRDTALTQFYEAALQGELETFSLSPEEASGFYSLMEALLPLPAGTPAFVKGQVVGPVTFATIVKGLDGKAILFDQELIQAVTQGLALKAAWQVAKIRETGRQAVIFFDEPSLTGLGSAFMQISREEVINLITETIAAAREPGEAFFGVHCCGNTDWSVLLETPIDILSFDSYEFFENLKLYDKHLKKFLARGGYLAWGLVPTSPTAPAETEEALWAKFTAQVEELVHIGLDKVKLLSQSLLTPACGLGYLAPDKAQEALAKLKALSRRAQAWLATL
jgi:methionine synthase II (cobalamin-independent)